MQDELTRNVSFRKDDMIFESTQYSLESALSYNLHNVGICLLQLLKDFDQIDGYRMCHLV